MVDKNQTVGFFQPVEHFSFYKLTRRAISMSLRNKSLTKV